MKRSVFALVAAAAVLASPLAFGQIVPPAPGVDLPQAYFDRIAENPKAFQFEKAWIEKARRARETREAFLSAPDTGEMSFASLPDGLKNAMMVSGTTYVPVLMGKYSNTGADPYPTASLQTKLFAPPPAASMTSLYSEMSYGNLTLTGTVYGWYLTSNIDTYYEGGCNGLCGTAKTGQFIKEVLQLADPAVNFGTYDNDGPDGIPNSGDDDGFVDFVAIVQPELGAECGATAIWSHRWVVGGWPEFAQNPWTTNDARTGGGNIVVWDYTIQPAQGSTTGCNPGIIEIGVFCHEFGHAFGLPDFYDTDKGSAGIGHWGLMGAGNWNTPTNPAHFDAYSKSELGWIVPTVVGPVSQAYTINNSEVNAEAFKLEIMEEKFRRTNVNPISGSYSMRCFLTTAEAAARSWVGGVGYGNGWDEAVVRDFSYNGTNPVNLQYDYAYHCEPGYDYGLVKIDVNGTVTTLVSYDGTGTGHANIDLTPYLNGSGATSYKLICQFTSDYGYSDEDGDYNSGTNGAFKIDNVSVTGGGVTYSTGFETYEDGWHYDRTLNPVQEYFLVENRNSTGAQFDQALHGQGLMICHVEHDVMTTVLGNSGNGNPGTAARGMMLEEADNLNHLLNNNNRGDAGDVFPGSANNTTFNAASAPNSNSLNALGTNAAVELIGAPGATMTANLRGGYFQPTLASIAPNFGDNDGPVGVDLLGGGFVYGATFLLRDASLNEYAATSVQWIGKAKLAGTLNLYGLPGGVYDVIVENPDGQRRVLPAAFTVNDVGTGIEAPGAMTNALYQNHPNPFNPTTTIRFSIKERGRVTLTIYNAAGQRVRTLVDEIQTPSAMGFSAIWNGTNDAGERVASGVYLYKLTTGDGYQSVRKLVLLK
jgi:M6 family metalloprotease-like protein